MFDRSAARHIEKTAVAKQQHLVGMRFERQTTGTASALVTWPDVVRVLQREPTRKHALDGYAATGWTADDLASARAARIAMAKALIATEDRLELEANGRATSERSAIRAVRRRLESEAA